MLLPSLAVFACLHRVSCTEYLNPWHVCVTYLGPAVNLQSLQLERSGTLPPLAQYQLPVSHSAFHMLGYNCFADYILLHKGLLHRGLVRGVFSFTTMHAPVIGIRLQPAQG